MDGPRDSNTEWNESARERKILHDTAYMWNLKRNDRNKFVYKTEANSQT